MTSREETFLALIIAVRSIADMKQRSSGATAPGAVGWCFVLGDTVALS